MTVYKCIKVTHCTLSIYTAICQMYLILKKEQGRSEVQAKTVPSRMFSSANPKHPLFISLGQVNHLLPHQPIPPLWTLLTSQI